MSAGIDSLRLYDRLRTKLPEDEARVIADALVEVVETDLATKRDLKELEYRLVIKMGGMLIALAGFLAVIRYFG